VIAAAQEFGKYVDAFTGTFFAVCLSMAICFLYRIGKLFNSIRAQLTDILKNTKVR